MNSDDSMALLREYAKSHSEQAFASLVSQYVNLVYSVALRQVRDTHLAEEITQTVFIILARKAKSLNPKTILAGWLCRTTRYVSADTLKIQRRRQFREHEAHMQSTVNQSDSEAWNQIAPLLDQALGRLGEKEHDAIVLRFLHGKELKDVGAAMGMSEDAARMRVNRGLESLRGFFASKHVTLSAAAIAAAVSANSIQAAPVGLAVSITTALFSGTALTTAVVAATKGVAMTTVQKTFACATVLALAGTGIYQGRQAVHLRGRLETLQQQQAPLLEQIEQLRHERGDMTNQLATTVEELARSNRDNLELLKLRAEVARLRTQLPAPTPGNRVGDPAEEAARAMVGRVNQLKQYLGKNPQENIPELRFVSDNDWLSASSNVGLETKDFETESDYKYALERLRGSAESRFAQLVQEALRTFSANITENPPDLSPLYQYCKPGVADILQQLYEIQPKSALSEAALKGATIKAEWFVTRKQGVNPGSSYRIAIFPYNTLLWQSVPPR